MGNTQKVRRLKAAGGLVVLLCAPLLLLMYFRAQVSVTQIPIGQNLPSLELSTLDGGNIQSENFTGKKLTLLFFTIECPKCMGQLENMHRLSSRYGKLIQFVGVSLSDRDKTREFSARSGYSFDLFQMDYEKAREIIGIALVPTILFVDENQILKQRLVGEQPLAKTEKAVQEFLIHTVQPQELRSD